MGPGTDQILVKIDDIILIIYALVGFFVAMKVEYGNTTGYIRLILIMIAMLFWPVYSVLKYTNRKKKFDR